MRFRYSFQKIVDLKSNEKTQAEWILSGAVGHLREVEESLQSLHSAKDEVRQKLGHSAADRTTASELMSYQQYINHLEQQIQRKTADMRQAEINVSQKRDVLSTKLVEEKVWNQARDKAYRIHQTILLKKEQDVLDELAATRHKNSV